MVKPDTIGDLEAAIDLLEISEKRIEDELDYPSHIKVTVIRETRGSRVCKIK